MPSGTPTDKDVLIAIYCATDGDNWESGKKTNWLTDMPLGTWEGVTADDNGTSSDNSDDIVTGLEITRGYLHGQLPPELGNLTNLTQLNISTNRFTRIGRYLTGPIPPEIGNLTNLTQLNLGSNQLSGPIPPELGNLTNLTQLKLGFNKQLSGPIPPELGKLTNLTQLNITTNQLSGPIPPELGKLINVEGMTLSNNQLTGSIPPQLGDLASVEYLYLDNNRLTGSIPAELELASNLSILWLNNNQLTGEIPPELGSLRFVQLYLNNNRLTGPIPPELANPSANLFTILNLSNNQLTGSIPAKLAGITSLMELDLSYNQLDEGIPDLSALTSMQYLYLDNNKLTGGIPNLSALTLLLHLYLNNNKLDGGIPDLSALTALERLYLNNNQLTGGIPNLSALTALERLYLNNNQLTGGIPNLSALTALGRLYLNNNQLTGEIPLTDLGNIADLEEIALWENPQLELPAGQQISDDLGKKIDRAVLRTLYEGTNGENWIRRKGEPTGSRYWTWFADPFVDSSETDPGLDLWKLPGVTVNGGGRVASLDLSNNNLVGVVDNLTLEQLDGLQTLNLSGNRSLGGTLPVGLMDLPGLRTVNIQCTGISAPTDPDFQTWLGTINFTGSRCPSFSRPRPPAPEPIDPSQDDIEELKVFYLETGGENWTDNTNWLSEDESLSQWYGVTVNDEDRVTALDLSGNGLSGSVPPSLGHLVSELETLNLADNPMLTGMLPLSLMNLSKLETLNIEGTGACAPDDEAFQQWLGTTMDFQGNVCVMNGNGACAIAGVGNTPGNTVFNLLLIISALIAVSWKSSSGARLTQHSG